MKIGLQSAFGFSNEDLALNRDGRVSPAQTARIATYQAVHQKGRRMALIAFGLTAIAATAPVIFLIGPGTDVARPYLIGFSALIWTVFLGVWFITNRHARQLNRAEITTLDGPVTTWSTQIRKGGAMLGTAYQFKVKGCTYQFESPDQYAAITSGASYCFHIIPNGRAPIILSVETRS